MSYATLMVHVDVDRDFGGRFGVAADVADLFGSHVIGVAGWGPMTLFLADEGLSDPGPERPHLQDMKTLLERRGQQFCQAVRNRGHRTEWRSALELPTEVIAREARAADLIVIGNEPETADPYRALDPGSVLLKAGRPVLVVPKAVASFSPKRVAVAWKDAREARRAVRDALPLLQKAESVMIVAVCEHDDGNQRSHRLQDVAGYLARHAIDIVVERVRPADVTVTATFLRMIEDENIDLIVAGAYGHSRLGEWAFGGVTRGLLVESPICVLFSH